MVATALTASATPASADRHDALKRDLGLTDSEVARLRTAETEAMDREAELRDTLGSDFGGVHLDAASGELTIAVTDPEAVPTVERAGANAEVVTFGESALNGFVDSLNSVADQADEQVTGWYADIADDSVVITVREGGTAAAEALVARAGVDERAVRVTKSDERPQLFTDIIGGNPYYFDGYRCSIGFSVRRGSESGFATAGHCGEEGTETSDPEGTVAGAYFPGRDMGWVRITDADTVTPLVNRYNGENVTVAGSREAATGSSVCRSGSTTGWRCGTIRSKNQTVRYIEGTVTGLTRTTACAEGGDSGGPWLTGSQGQGVTSGGSGNCTLGGVTYFQPLNPLLSHFDLDLVTG
ncbi:S1 family peptidase [Thermobifida halotolerans]|uniref:S1 family peptidase n=1 Tax=Thermobifida halotolerans TaxID=483545 RepID=A0AA97M6G4_9ACTN|nr:S1 family peptidase [Thermobifida halotolerans]